MEEAKGAARRTAFSETAKQHVGLRTWEARWHDLSVHARDVFLTVVKGPPKNTLMYPSQLSVSLDKFPPHILKELTDAGFVEVKTSKAKVSAERVYATAGLHDFATRVRNLRKFHLLAADQPSEFAKYVQAAFHGGQLYGILSTVLSKAGIESFIQHDSR